MHTRLKKLFVKDRARRRNGHDRWQQFAVGLAAQRCRAPKLAERSKRSGRTGTLVQLAQGKRSLIHWTISVSNR
jgi:hypothetical protein